MFERNMVRKAPIVDVVVDPILTKHLRPHQREGVKFLYECVMGMKQENLHGAILADAMGLGKTIQTIALIWTLLSNTSVALFKNFVEQNPYAGQPVANQVLVVCPATLVNNWKNEFKKWLGDERIKVFAVGQQQAQKKKKKDDEVPESIIRDFVLGNRIFSVMVVSYERIRMLTETAEFKKIRFDLVVCDEGHRLKSANIKTAAALKSLPIRRRILLSGTPLQNDLSEFFAMADFVNPGLLGSYARFKNVFEDPIVRSRQMASESSETASEAQRVGEMRSQELSRLTALFILRRTAEVNQAYLPPKLELTLFCLPTDDQRRLYETFLDAPNVRGALSGLKESLDPFCMVMLLRQLCNDPNIFLSALEKSVTGIPEDLQKALTLMDVKKSGDEGWFPPESSGKMNVLKNLLRHISSAKEKVVVVSNFTQTLDAIQEVCKTEGYSFVRLDGSTPSSKRAEYVEKFNRPESTILVFLLSSKSGGTGLTLSSASRLILFDNDWNPATDQQAMARIWRDGSTRQCVIYRLILVGGLEEMIYRRGCYKTDLSDFVIDEKANKNTFSKDALKSLFKFHDARQGDPCPTHTLLSCKCLQVDPLFVPHDSEEPPVKRVKLDNNQCHDNDEDEDDVGMLEVDDSLELEVEKEEKVAVEDKLKGKFHLPWRVHGEVSDTVKTKAKGVLERMDGLTVRALHDFDDVSFVFADLTLPLDTDKI